MIATIARPKAPTMSDDQTEPTTTAPPKTREYWRDWISNQTPTLSVDELLQRVQERGVDCDLRTLRSWQNQRVLPFPIRQYRDDALYAVYPAAAIDFIARIRDMQAHGLQLQAIGPRLRAWAKGYGDRDVYTELKNTLRKAVDLERQITGVPVRKAELTFTDDVGVTNSYTITPMVRWRVGVVQEPSD